MKISKKYTMYLIHHSHTDIGYTDTQERALHHQASYIYDLIEHFDNDPTSDFKWNCETFVAVEEFLKEASLEDIAKFGKLIKEGKLELSANYANFSEVLDPAIMERMIKRAIDFGVSHGYEPKCAMQADVNGFGLGYANAMANCGIEFFLTLVHTHHGMFPMFKKQVPFYWEMPNNKKILVWSGEHYMFGNAFGFAEGAIANYGFGDDVDVLKLNRDPNANWIEMAEKRMEKYLDQLESDDFTFDFFPACVQGKYTDNAMPNFEIINRVKAWNEKNSNHVEVKMVSLREFYEVLKKEENIETVSGEWPDWWTDGVGSAPRELKIIKNTQTKYEILKKLDKDRVVMTDEIEKSLDYDLALYAEHTYGAWSSIGNPFDTFANESWAGKQWYAFNAMRNIDKCYIKLENHLGSCGTKAIRSSNFKIINPNDTPTKDVIKLPFHSADSLFLNGKYKIHDGDKNYEYVCDGGNYPHILVELDGNEEKIIYVEFVEDGTPSTLKHYTYSRYQLGGTDNVDDCRYNKDQLKGITPKNIIFSQTHIENEFYSIKWDGKGIHSWFDKELGIELLNGEEGGFTPVYEVTKETPRNQIGRNRKGIDVERNIGRIIKVKKVLQNPMLITISLTYKIDGCFTYENIITLYRDIKKVDISVKIGKNIVWEPENLYISTPFKKEKLVIDKKNSVVTPRENQLPGSLVDFYAAYDGIGFINKGYGVTLSTPDTHLIHYGDLEFRERVLAGDPKLKQMPENVYIWAMNNIWETNFIANLGNFYEFRYSISSGEKFRDKEVAINKVRTDVKKPFIINFL